MSTEKQLIDANALLEELDKFANPMPNKSGYDFLCGVATVITEIENAPTVDAVEVVRCKNCKNCTLYYPEKRLDKEATPAWLCERYKRWRNPDFFCADGERREGE